MIFVDGVLVILKNVLEKLVFLAADDDDDLLMMIIHLC